MKANDLRALQAPLKQRYKDEPSLALVTLRAHGSLGDASVSCRVETGRALLAGDPDIALLTRETAFSAEELEPADFVRLEELLR